MFDRFCQVQSKDIKYFSRLKLKGGSYIYLDNKLRVLQL